MEFDAGIYDVAVIGAGHAGIEAGLACADGTGDSRVYDQS